MLPAGFTVTQKDNGLLIRNTETGGSAFVSSAYDAPAEKMLYQLAGALMGPTTAQEQPIADKYLLQRLDLCIGTLLHINRLINKAFDDGLSYGTTTAPTDAPGLYLESGEFVPAGELQQQQQPERGAYCKGSWELGTACGKCRRCKETMPKQSGAQPAQTSRFQTTPAKLSTDRTCMVDTSAEYQPMATCPVGVTVRLLNPGGVATDGQWDGKDTQWQGWAGMPRVPDWMRK